MGLAIGVNGYQVERILFEEIRIDDAQKILLNDHAVANLTNRHASEEPAAGAVLGHACDQPFGEAMDRGSVLIIRAHQRGAGSLPVLGRKAEHRLDTLLHLERDLVEMAPAQKMQRVAHPPQK